MKVGDLVQHEMNKKIGVIVGDCGDPLKKGQRWLVAYGDHKRSEVEWILKVKNESR